MPFVVRPGNLFMMDLRERYSAIEEKTGAFSAATGIACPTGCGDCCTAIDFPISRDEAEAVASYLLDHPPVLERFLAADVPAAATGKAPCPLYDPDSPAAHCTVYPVRPLLCRTFAFSAHRGKDGVPVYAPCHRFRETAAGEARIEEARVAVRSGRLSLPVLPDEAMAVQGITLGPDALPIGPSVARALDALRYRRDLEQA